jgi:hypothetical protein
MAHLYLVFLEEVLQNILSAVRVVKSTIAFQKSSDSFFIQMSSCDFFFGKFLDAFNNFFICHFENDQLSWG